MRDHLLDLVSHSFDLGCIELVKISGTTTETVIDGLAEDRSVVLQAKFHNPVADFIGTFGMPNLNKLKIILNLSEYKENATISIKKQDRNGESVPVGMNFVNAAGDFKNDYRFMTSEIINEKLKAVKFKGVSRNISFEPSMAAIGRLKMQAAANAEELHFIAKTENGDLKFMFGDHSTHAGEFVFEPGISGTLKRSWSWPVRQFIGIMDLVGDKKIEISDDGAAQITVDSGVAEYKYILPAQSK